MVFACCAAPTAPYDEVDQLTREEVRALYRKCLEANNGRLIVSGLFARADVENNNKRLYPKGVLKREVARFRQNHVRAGTALGELDHPNYASRFFRCLNLPNVSHQVLDVHWLGSCLMGTIEILPTPSGLLLWELYARGVKLGVSSRGWASLKPDPRRNCTVVDEDFELITFDFVTEPSNKGAVMVPLTRPWAKPLPDQRRYVELAHLGMGMVHMEHLQGASHDPTFDAAAFMMRARDIAADAGCELHALPAGSGFRNPGTPQRHAEPGLKLPGYKGKRTELDKWLLYSHYLVNKVRVRARALCWACVCWPFACVCWWAGQTTQHCGKRNEDAQLSACAAPIRHHT